MRESNQLALSDWGQFLLNKVLHPAAVFGTPLFILALVVYFVACAFGRGVYMGVRSFAGALLPLIVATYIFIFRKEILGKLGDVDVLISYVASLIWGTLLMAAIRIFGGPLSTVPIIELVLSASFSILVFSYVSLPHNKVLSYYYGIVCGFLIFIILWGFPIGA